MVATVGRCYTNPQDYAQENYYTQGQGLANSQWLGKAASTQGLSSQIQEKHFHNAYQALDPEGNPLRKQQNYTKQSKRHNRPGTDVTLSAPKSVSVAALVMGDRQILEAHFCAVRATMDYVENNCIFYQTKQRGQKLILPSRTAQIAVFHHDDNRNKDPQLHSHCVILNQTLCPDGKWRAVANAQLYKQQKTIGAYYAHELARQLKEIGWEVEWTDDHTFELVGVNKDSLNAIFSTRSNQIEAELAQLGLTRKTATAEQKQALCLKTRPEKRHHLHPSDRERQLEEWRSRATEAGIQITKECRNRLEKAYRQPSHPGRIGELVHSATDVLTERQTAFQQHELLKECLRQSQGRYDPIQIRAEIGQFPELVSTRDGRLTTRRQLARERQIIELAQAGRNSRTPLASEEQARVIALSRNLNSGQAAALIQMTTSRDALVLVQGNAGVGKTYTMKALSDTIGSQPIRGLAPSAAAADVLHSESGIDSQTLASYLLTDNERLAKTEVLLVDEAGMLSTKQVEQLLQKAQATDSRVILVGDTKQLAAVEAGAPFKLLQDQGLPTAIIDQNLRQRDPSLKQVVDLMATHDQNQGSVNQAYLELYNQEKIRPFALEEKRIEAITRDYLNRPSEIREKTLILAGTNADRQAISRVVRQSLLVEGILGSESAQLQTLRRKDIDPFAITQAHSYQRGDVIKFQADSAQFSRDFYYRVTAVNSQANTVSLIDTAGVVYTLPLEKYKQREVYQAQQLEIRPGEQMRFTKNLRSQSHQQLNGQRFTVEGLSPDEQIVIQTKGKTLAVSPSQLLHSDYRYADTVHSSQGQTADYCIYSASPAKSLTVGRESFYVAASRARQEFVVYTASAQDLGVTIQMSRANENALDLVPNPISREDEKKHAQQRPIQTAELQPENLSNPTLPLTEPESWQRSDERDEQSVRPKPEPSQRRTGFDQVIDSLTDSSRRAEELAENLRGPGSKAEASRRDEPSSCREAEDFGNRRTEPNRAAEDFAREFQRLEERARSSDRQNRKNRKSAGQGLGAIAAQLRKKIQQFARDIEIDSEDTKQRQVQGDELAGGSVRHQAARTAQGDLDYPPVHEPSHLGTQPNQSSQQHDTARDQRSGQQQRNPSQPDREEVSSVKPTQLPEPAPLPEPQPQTLSQNEVNQIFLTAKSAIERYGREWEQKTTFNNANYQIQKFSVSETYGYRSYFTIDAQDGRGKLLTLKGQNFHPANLKVLENRLNQQDVKKFREIKAALDYLQQVRQLFDDAKTILLRYGERDSQQSFKGYGTLEGEKYQIIFNEQELRIVAKDGRGEILNYPSASDARYPEARAKAIFTPEDVELFRSIVKQIEAERQGAEQRWQKEREQLRQRGKGLER